VELDPVARLRVLAAALPHVWLVESVLDAPFEAVWAVAGDLEGAPSFETLVGEVRVLERNGPELQIASRVGPARFRLVDVGMAARPEGRGQTRFAHYEGIRSLGRLVHPWLRWTLPRELRAIEKLARAR
jgi:hypothetical protein